MAHGPAPYQNDPENSRSYFITVKDAAGTAHSVVLGVNRQQFWHATQAFLTMPAVT